MQHHLLNTTAQFIMGIGLLTILMFLVVPVIKSSYQVSAPRPAAYVLELGDSKLSTQRMLINRIRKLISQNNHASKVEVVATGKGVCFYEEDNIFAKDIRTLASLGVVFTACQQSIKSLEFAVGHPLALIQGVQLRADGHMYAESLKNEGYIDELA